MTQTTTKRTWRPGRLELQVSEIARQMATEQAGRIPWPILYEARENYIWWEAFALWVRAVEDVERTVPEWLVKVIKRRCRGLREIFTWDEVQGWINGRILAAPSQEGWMDAVGYFAERDLRSLRNNAYWEHCEREWKRSKPAVYPSFREWLTASEKCSDDVVDEFEMREEKCQLIKHMRRVGPRMLQQAVERYVEWEVFAFWTRTALEGNFPLPVSIEKELERGCSGFLEAETAARGANPAEETYCRFDRLFKWIEDHKFAKAQKEAWFDVLRYQARLHPRHARVTDYWHDWEAQWEKHPAAEYPAFNEWRGAADRYSFDPADA
jgi:hypothetical protein